MGRKKIQISRIVDQRNRQVTFTKRKFGLMKKAYELSVLCDCEIALIIFNSTNRLFQYASTDMDKVLLKYTEYSEPHESRTNADILETLRRKGLGLDGSELESEEVMSAVATEKYQQLNEGMDLSITRQRYYAPPLLPSEAQYLVSGACENGFSPGNPASSGLGSHRPPPSKPPGPKPGIAGGWGSHSQPPLMPPHAGIGYSMFSHGHLSRTLAKTPPPLNLGSDGRRMEGHPGLTGTRSLGTARVLYPGVPAGNHVVTMGKTGLLGHSLGGYGLSSAGPPEYPHPGFSHSVTLQRGAISPWQQEPHHVAHSSLGMSSSGCSFSAHTSAPTPPPHPSLNLSIKSERVSPVHTCSSATPPLQHVAQHSPISNPDSTGHAPQDPYATNEREDYQKGGYISPQVLCRAHPEDKQGPPSRRSEIAENWQR
uniref:Myocyte enhancer factor 2b n=1 Tax=Lepisosteus oculatus TaxID=7918 RepID=W5MBL7_LEPOC|nr:PREDICTED: myocyte-specific enhancer factor 2B [Lepisosteus oculatus]